MEKKFMQNICTLNTLLVFYEIIWKTHLERIFEIFIAKVDSSQQQYEWELQLFSAAFSSKRMILN